MRLCLVLGSEDGRIPTFWLLVYDLPHEGCIGQTSQLERSSAYQRHSILMLICEYFAQFSIAETPAIWLRSYKSPSAMFF